MKFSDDHIKSYLAGKLDPKDSHQIEMEAADDPFLRDLIDGFQENSSGLVFYNKNVKHARKSGKYWGIVSLGALSLLGLLLLFKPGKKDLNIAEQEKVMGTMLEVNTKENISNKFFNESEKLDSSLTLLTPISEEKRLDINLIKKDQQTTHAPAKSEKETVHIIDNPSIKDKPLTIEPEPAHKSWGQPASSSFMHDLFVVDYRKIKRESRTIDYTRMELSGIDAAYENEEKEENRELIEVNVKISYWDYLGKAMWHISREEYRASLNQYLIILKQYPEDLNAKFYGGLSYYNLGVFEKAQMLFDEIKNSKLDSFKEEAMWFSAKCDMELGTKNNLERKLEDIIAAGGFYTERAISLRKKINSK